MRSENPGRRNERPNVLSAVRVGVSSLFALLIVPVFALGQATVRMSANRLADEGKYAEAVAAAKKDLKAGDPADQAWLRDLEEEKRLRDLANKLRSDNRIDDAIAAAKLALALKDKRNAHRQPRTLEDSRWLIDMQNSKTTSESGLTLFDLEQVLQMEYRDKWFDYKSELHEGGLLADAIAKAGKSQAELKAAQGEKQADTIAAQARFTQLNSERSELLAKLRRNMAYRDEQYARGDMMNGLNGAAMTVDLKRKIYGENDLTFAISLAEHARMEQKADQWSMAWHHFEQAQAVFAQLYGGEHWRTKDAQVAFEESKRIMGEFEKTRTHIRDARSRSFKAARLLEKGHYFDALRLADEDETRIATFVGQRAYSHFAANQTCLASIYRAMGRFSEAEQRQRRALDILKEIYGEEHPDYLRALNTLFELYKILGDHAQALATARSSLALTEKVWGAKHGEYAVSLNNLGEAELTAGRLDEARELFVQALKLSEQHFAAYGQSWTTSLQNLAEVRRLWGEYGESARLMQHVVKNRKIGYGQGHPETLDAMYHLADVEIDSKNYADAAATLAQVLDASKFVHGPKHIKRAQYLSSLARLHRAQGDDEKSEPVLRECLEIARVNLDTTFAVLSERRQLAMTRDAQRMLFAYVDLAVTRKQPGEDAYQFVLAWKGAVLGRQQQSRLAADKPELMSLLKDYQETSRQLATLALATTNPAQRDAVAQEIDKLSQKKERLEGELSRKSDTFRQSHEPFTIEKLKGILPQDSALVDFMEYADTSPTAPHDGETPRQLLVVYVVRPGAAVQQIDLGDTAPIRALGEQWRADIMRGRGGVGRGLKLVPPKESAKTAAAMPQIELRRRLWEPLEPHLEGAKLLLLSPDGAVAKLPLAALPGREVGKYLIEEMSIVVVPSPSQLAQLMKSPADVRSAGDISLLVVGDVDFGAAAGTSRAEGDQEVPLVQRSAPRFGNAIFSPLPGTGREVKSIAALFRERFATSKLSELLGADATEGRLREAGPGHRYLHLATHGFFAPDSLPGSFPGSPAASPADRKLRKNAQPGEKITELHPGLLSGIALAGANPGKNRPAADQASAVQGDTMQDDGVFTALEVASLDLGGVELAILSACETGLGQTAGGEGLLGLQRSFQVAGVRSTIASLWKVDDSATQVLMIEFYRNLWEKKLSKLESLRQAQLTMLQRYDSRQQILLSRGLKPVTPAKGSEEPAPLAPYYWAAFMLSGDWR